MKPRTIVFSFCSSILFCACIHTAGTTGPTIPQTIVLDGYGSKLDSSYYKVWSDSSWEEFHQDTTINGITYQTLLDSYDNEYFYDSSGYAGLKLNGYSAFVFDAPLPPPPDTMVSSQTYKTTTTFSYHDTSYVLEDDEAFQGTTASITVPFGTFTNCPGITSNQSISSGGMAYLSSSDEYWLAKGPSEIRRAVPNYGTIVMVYGVVNGQGWGVKFPETQLNHFPFSASLAKMPWHLSANSNRTSIDIHSLAPMILKGIIR